MSRAAAREAMKSYRDNGGITSAQSSSDAQNSVAADIEKHKDDDKKEPETLTPDDIKPETVTEAAPSGNDTKDKVIESLSTSLEKASEATSRVRDKVAMQRTPGGIAAALIILFVLVFILVPVDVAKQYSRAQLLVMSLLGHTRLIGRKLIGNAKPVVQMPVQQGADGEPSSEDDTSHTTLYVEQLMSEASVIDAQAQYQHEEVYEDAQSSGDDDYWSSIDNMNHDGL